MHTAVEVLAWRGRELVDPDGETIGEIAAAFQDRDTHSPEWLGVATARAPGELAIVPIAGASEAGRAVTVPHLAAEVHAAPHVRAGDAVELEVERERALARHYGLLYDREQSGSGIPVEAGLVAHRRPATRRPPPGPGARDEVADALAGLRALERSLATRLNALSLDVGDEELAHDLRLHLRTTHDHAEALDARLEELGGRRAPLTELVASVAARRRAKAAAAAPGGVVLALCDVYASVHRLGAGYTTLADRAARAGDPRTADLARRHDADAQARLATFDGTWERIAGLADDAAVAALRDAAAHAPGDPARARAAREVLDRVAIRSPTGAAARAGTGC